MKRRVLAIKLLLALVPSALFADEATEDLCRKSYEQILTRLQELNQRIPISVALNEVLPDPKLRHGGWRYRIDDQKGMWLSGRSNYARGVTEVYFRTPQKVGEPEQFLVMMDYLRKNGLNELPPSKAGIAIHFDSAPDSLQVYQIIDQAKLRTPQAQSELPTALRNLPQDYREYLIQGYGDRLKMDLPTRNRLRQISTAAQDRSMLFVKTKEPYVRWRDDENEILIYQNARNVETAQGPAAYPIGRTLPEHFEIEGGALVVTSTSEQELLPLESLTGYRIARKPGETLAEIGRFFVGKDGAQDTSPRLIALMASAITSRRKVDRIIIEADAVRARLFKRYGFKEIHSQKNYEGKTEYIMEVTPEEFFSKAAGLMLEGLPEARPLPRMAPTEEAIFYSHPENHLIPGDRSSPVVALGGGGMSQLLTRIQDIAKSSASPLLQHREIRRELTASAAFAPSKPSGSGLKASDADQLTTRLIDAWGSNGDPVEVLRKFLIENRRYDLLERYFPTNPFLLMRQDFEAIALSYLSDADKIMHLLVLMSQDSRIVRQFEERGMRRVAERWLRLHSSGKTPAEIASEVYRELRFGG